MRVKCIKCGNLILQSTADSNVGLCGLCAKGNTLDKREELRNFNKALDAGLTDDAAPASKSSSLDCLGGFLMKNLRDSALGHCERILKGGCRTPELRRLQERVAALLGVTW